MWGFLCGQQFSAPSGKCQGAGWLDCMVRVCSLLQEDVIHTLFQSGRTILHFRQQRNESFYHSTSLPAFPATSVLDLGHSDSHAVAF